MDIDLEEPGWHFNGAALLILHQGMLSPVGGIRHWRQSVFFGGGGGGATL